MKDLKDFGRRMQGFTNSMTQTVIFPTGEVVKRPDAERQLLGLRIAKVLRFLEFSMLMNPYVFVRGSASLSFGFIQEFLSFHFSTSPRDWWKSHYQLTRPRSTQKVPVPVSNSGRSCFVWYTGTV